jgi:hypothetical protein
VSFRHGTSPLSRRKRPLPWLSGARPQPSLGTASGPTVRLRLPRPPPVSSFARVVLPSLPLCCTEPTNSFCEVISGENNNRSRNWNDEAVAAHAHHGEDRWPAGLEGPPELSLTQAVPVHREVLAQRCRRGLAPRALSWAHDRNGGRCRPQLDVEATSYDCLGASCPCQRVRGARARACCSTPSSPSLGMAVIADSGLSCRGVLHAA